MGLLDSERHALVRKEMHDTLSLATEYALMREEMSYGNLFSKVDYLARKHHIQEAEVRQIHTLRRHSNFQDTMSREDALYDLLALARFVAAVFSTSVPESLIKRLPAVYRAQARSPQKRYRTLRCVVTEWTRDSLKVTIDGFEDGALKTAMPTKEDMQTLLPFLRKGTFLSLLDAEQSAKDKEADIIRPKAVVFEPDFLLDISAVASLFHDFGHHPLLYTLNKMLPKVNNIHTLLGNFAGEVVDEAVTHREGTSFHKALRENFKQKALEFATAKDFTATAFKTNAEAQTRNAIAAVDTLFKEHDRERALVEPSFVSPELGLQGRVDLMTGDLKLLVEQKSSKNFALETGWRNASGNLYEEKHYVQLLLYYAVLGYRYGITLRTSDFLLLYSKYEPKRGLQRINIYRQLMYEALRLRNQIVAFEMLIAEKGFQSVSPLLTPDVLNEKSLSTKFFLTYELPRLKVYQEALESWSETEREYFFCLATASYKEQLQGKIGGREHQGSCISDLWNLPLATKLSTGSILAGLSLLKAESQEEGFGVDTLTFLYAETPAWQGAEANAKGAEDDSNGANGGMESEEYQEICAPNFRLGDRVVVYPYKKGTSPNAKDSLLLTGQIARMNAEGVVVILTNGQRSTGTLTRMNPTIDRPKTDDRQSGRSGKTGKTVFAIEHAPLGSSNDMDMRSLFAWSTAEKCRKDLILGLLPPEKDAGKRLSRPYHKDLDGVLEKIAQMKDYFLLIGPPGTGKTSMAMRFIVEEELQNANASVLLAAYTNRAVDEICAMLQNAGIDFLRIGNRYSADQRFHSNLLDDVARKKPSLSAIVDKISSTRVIVATTCQLMAKSYLFNIKRFSLAVFDEASQLTEAGLVGLLAAYSGDGSGKPAIGKFVLIGDHKQLPAVVQTPSWQCQVKSPKLREIGLFHTNASLFERLLWLERERKCDDFVGVLHKYGRMHPQIAEFCSTHFYEKEHILPVLLPHQRECGISDKVYKSHAKSVLAKEREIFVPSASSGKSTHTGDKSNKDEAEIVALLIKHLYAIHQQSWDNMKTVGVIVPYRNQIALIRQELCRLGIASISDISIDTVERYQGSQREIVIFSLTATRPYQMDFLSATTFEEDGHLIDRKLNVALTRARRQMIVTGNPGIMQTNAVYRSFLHHLQSEATVLSKEELLNG